MSSMTLNKLVEKLSPECKLSLEKAVAICNSRSHFVVELEHWLIAMLENQLDDVRLILSAFDVDADVVKNDLNRSLESFKTGSESSPSLSHHVTSLLRQSWLSTSIEFTDTQIRSAYVIYTLIKDDALSSLLTRCSKQFNKIDPGQLLHAWPGIMAQSQESNVVSGSSEQSSLASASKTPSLDQFTVDLTAQAESGRIDPILGRDFEIRQMIDILTRRRQNNPILTGEAGVGKTAVVEGLALRIAQQSVPDVLKNVRIHSLDLALLQAGAGMKGEFENRLKTLISEVKSSSRPIVIFIDEAHTMIGSGGQAGQNDAANLLKPALARGELRTIAATTWAEYKKYFEKDAALSRRFQVVKVEEPDPLKAISMLRGLVSVMEKHHNVFISEQALESAVNLSHRYIVGRQLPDKAVGLLDTACARVAMSQASVPNSIEQLENKIYNIDSQISMLLREEKSGLDHAEKINELQADSVKALDLLVPLKEQFEKEKVIVSKLSEAFNKISGEDVPDVSVLESLQKSKNELSSFAQNMVHWQVDEEVIAQVISDWTGIPVGKMQQDEVLGVLKLADTMKERVVGQDHALDLIAKVVQTSRAHLADENRPNGIFMLTGPSGVGKTETALTLAQEVYGSEENITIINMSEFKEEHKVSLLLGSPPGYVGYGEGGILTEAVRRKPYSVILLDEMEKAHPGVHDIFYQVFDKGMIKDGEGRDIDFKNTIIIMTSNVGTDTTMGLYEDEEALPSIKGLQSALQDDLLAVFKPAFLGRINVIPYVPLSDKVISQIANFQLLKIKNRIRSNYDCSFSYDDGVLDHIVANCQNAGSGARNIHTLLQNKVLPLLSELLLSNMVEDKEISNVVLSLDNNDFSVVVS
jgi:type VI secretion system protein VasG